MGTEFYLKCYFTVHEAHSYLGKKRQG